MEKINLDNIWFVGYAFQIEMKYSAIKHGFNVKEIPIHFKDRELGQSKMNIKIFREAFIGVLKLKSKNLMPKVVIRNAEIINEGLTFNGDLAIEGNYISEVKRKL